MRSRLLATAIATGLGLTAITAAGNAVAASPAVTAEQLAELQSQIAALQAQVAELQAQNEAQSDVNITQAKALDATLDTQKTVDKLNKLVNDTSLSGRVFFDLSHIDATSGGKDTAATGTGFDVKRFYLGVTHKFDDTWSANLTTDFTYSSTLGATHLFVKKAYLQGKFSDAFTFRAGSADMPWIPYAESFYGLRYVENTLVDRLKYGNSADWGLHAGGDIANGMGNYAASVVTGAGYKNPTRGKSMDIEARAAFVPVQGVAIALGGYNGTLGKETGTVDAIHDASRIDAMVAYASKNWRVGAEYFQAKNYANVLTVATDKADGWSVWGSAPLTAGGITAFARYDRADTSKTLDPTLENTYWNLGVEFPVIKGFKLATVYKDTKNQNATTIDQRTKEFGVWGDVAF